MSFVGPNKLLEGYDAKRLRIATLGSHSALEICEGAKSEGLPTLVVCAKGREKTYSKYYKTRQANAGTAGCVDETILLEDFKQIALEKTVAELRAKNCLFVPHKSLTAYAGYDAVERDFGVPLFGNRFLLRAEERGGARDQNYLFEKAGLRTPRKFSYPSQIDSLAIVKAADESRGFYERAFFLCSGEKEFEEKSKQLLDKKIVSKAGLERAAIEEFVVGAQVNFNFFHSPLSGELELLGTDFRRQTNLDGLLRVPAKQQIELAEKSNLRETTVEVGHVASTVRESLLEHAFEAGEKFVEACAREYPPGIIGPFALQGAIAQEGGKEVFLVFDASLRIPGSPGTRFTPYSHYLRGEAASAGRRIAMEVKLALREEKLDKIVT